MIAVRRGKFKPYKVVLPVIVVLLLIVAGIKIPRFLSVDNILNVIRQTSIVSLVSYGSAMVIIAKGIDLSVGGLIACCAMISGLMMKAGIPIIIAIAAGIAAGALMGLFSGFMVEKLEVPAFITTLEVSAMHTFLSEMAGFWEFRFPFI